MKTIIVILLLIIGLMGCSLNEDGVFDNLGGAGVGEDTNESTLGNDGVIADQEIETIPSFEKIEKLDDAININLNEINSSSNFTFENDTLTIVSSGTYVLSGKLNGRVVVTSDAGKVNLILNNATIYTKESQNQAAIVYEKSDEERVLTIWENSVNYLSDSTADDENGDNAVIQAKKSSLIITGSGKLNIDSNGSESTGIKVKKELKIVDANIDINVSDHGIKSGTLLALYNTNITITALGDGMKTDVEAENSEDADVLTKDPFSGYIYIENSSLDINAADDGISANSYLKINNTNEDLIKIITNNGAAEIITETSSDNADGKAIKVDGIVLVEAEEETELLSQCEDNYLLVILGGRFEINSNSDAISSKGNLLICGGEFEIVSGDDAIHAEYLTKIVNGNFTITRCYEGIEGASVEILGGTIKIISTDDGINAANSDLKNYSYNIYISGGNIEVNAEGDGIDSNGTMEIAGGKVIIYGPTKSDNCALDADKGILINSGNVIALGPSGMVESPSTNSSQCSIVYNLTSQTTNALKITDSDGNELVNIDVPKVYQSIVVSLSTFEKGSTYNIGVGSTTKSVTLSSVVNNLGMSFGPNGGGPRPPRW